MHPPLTLPRLTQFFVAANHHHTTDDAGGEGDTASQLTYSEFLGVLGRICDCRVVAEEELQMVQRQRLQSLSLHHRIGDRSGAAGLAATLQMMAGVGDGA